MRGFEGFRSMSKTCPCIQIIVFTSLALIALLSDLLAKGSKNLFFSSLPSSPWSWTPSSSSFSGHSSPPPPPPNPQTSLYPTFSNAKMHKAVETLMEELNEKKKRRGREREKEMEMIEAGLVRARASIKDAIIKSRDSPQLLQDPDYVPQAQIYRNPYVFQRSYMVMEKTLKIYIYEEGEPPLFHYGPSKGIYSTEGIFLGLLESSRHLRTYDPDEAHLYLLPFSVVMILEHLFHPIERDKAVLERVVGDYVRIVSTKYPYWNRSLGADHFMLSCHDWGPRATWYVRHLYFTSIRLLCNANTSEFFNPRKDVSLPEINLRFGELESTSSNNNNNRSILAFFAGGLHGKIRGVLFRHWKEREGEEEIRVYEGGVEGYREMMEGSRYCLCPSGYEVASPRVVEAIYAGCVPVLISQDYVPPLSDVLDWDTFSVRVSVEEVPELKEKLKGIGEGEYEALRRGVAEVRRHFLINDPPNRYDAFNMIIHSLWLRRLNLLIHP